MSNPVSTLIDIAATCRNTAETRARLRRAVALAVLAFAAMAGCDGDGSSLGNSGPTQSEPGVCYVELKKGFWCDDGQVDAGVWEVVCWDIAKERCNATEFPSTTEYFDGCDWETKYERHTWMSPDECAERQSVGLLLPDGAECAYHQDCASGCCGKPGASVCAPCGSGSTGAGGTGAGGTGAGGTGAGGTGTGGTGGCSVDLPVACPAHGGAVAGCWPAGTACGSVVECPSGDAACPAGQAVDCGANMCLPVVPSFESSDGACDNGMDDDGNGYIDCKDFHCLTNPLVSVCGGETTNDRCSNMMDDDGNGFIDCADISCRSSPSVTVCGTTENTDAECNNTLDDDGNNYTDCLDLACVSSAFTSICP